MSSWELYAKVVHNLKCLFSYSYFQTHLITASLIHTISQVSPGSTTESQSLEPKLCYLLNLSYIQ
jgi:hypothetical protein